MTTIFNLLCPICTEMFHNNDDIHATVCGHVLHSGCMRQWFDCSSSCPQCRRPNPSTHKLYLSFDESSKVVADMKELTMENNNLKDHLKMKTKEYRNKLGVLRSTCKALQEIKTSLEKKNFSQSREIKKLSMTLESLKSKNNVTINELRSELSAAQLRSKNEVENLYKNFDIRGILLATGDYKRAQLPLERMNFKYAREMHDKMAALSAESSHSIGLQQLSKELESMKASIDATIIELESKVNAIELNVSLTSRENQPTLRSSSNTTSNVNCTSTESEENKFGNDFDPSSILLSEELSKNAKISLECIKLNDTNCKIFQEANQEHDSSQLMLFREKNKELEEKLKLIREELDMAVTKNSHLERANRKLRKSVECMKLHNPLKNTRAFDYSNL